MPEGDTLHRLAAVLRPLLLDTPVDSLQLRDRRRHADLHAQRIVSIEALGKNLLLGFERGAMLRVHLGLYGSWHRYGLVEPWHKPAAQARLIIRTPQQVHICFNARRVEFERSGKQARKRLEQRLGPDLAAPSPAFDDIIARARTLLAAHAPLVDLLLDQRVAAGIGNVYKSEVLFMTGHHPETRVEQLEDHQLQEIYALAARLLRANISRSARDTRGIADGGGRLWVYARAGRPCLNCATPIRSGRLGRHLRETWWCPRCQAPQA